MRPGSKYYSVSYFDGSVSIVFEVIFAFGGSDGLDEGADVIASVFDGALLGASHPVLDLGEGLLDWIEIGGIGRQERAFGASLLDGLPDSLALMASEIVHDHKVAGLDVLGRRHEVNRWSYS